ncbi:hypothetical protein [Photobacterium lipolyticum]|uniref:Uncharacterized protein n=1 Tax=Photobacterium lipolyticum TaxID=266810 RepID=A0A2T3MMF1_9GAMM|nr:hypothetical protein [Photobacterium lipolyticum]PSV97697.1 hypothetical protein C9I89_22180 [Photobacterium lipolyticum]
MTNEVYIAAFGLASYVTGHFVSHLFTSKRNKQEKLQNKITMAKFAKAELLNLKIHMENNLEKLNSMLEAEVFGEEVDFQKLKFTDDGLIALKLENLHVLHGTLSQDLLTMSLYSRNNEFEVASATELLFGTGNNSDKIKVERIEKLIERFEITRDKASKLQEYLDEYRKNPDKYQDKGSIWSRSMFVVKKT